MKKNILALVIALFAVIQTMAQTYDNLWKQADAYRQKDLPKSEIGVMIKISAKASASKDYGQLLAAEMRQAMLWKSISTDSLAPAILCSRLCGMQYWENSMRRMSTTSPCPTRLNRQVVTA